MRERGRSCLRFVFSAVSLNTRHRSGFGEGIAAGWAGFPVARSR